MKPFACLARCAGLSVFVLAGAAPALAGQVVLSDPLSTWPLNFGAQGAEVFLKNGAVHISVPINGANWVSYNGFTFTDMDASVTITPMTATGNAAGLIFWGTGPSDFFEFSVSDTGGSFAVYRHVSTSASPWQAVVPYMKSALVKAGAANTLRVVTKGNAATLYINGQVAGSLSLMAPPSGGAVGLEGEGGAKGPADYAFSNLTVSQ
jgi:hypothetical protein